MERFYFKSYDRTVGSAGTLEELRAELKRLAGEDPGCVNYHLREGHIVQWLNYIGERDAATSLSGVGDASVAVKILGDGGRKAGGRRSGNAGNQEGKPHRKGRPRKVKPEMQK